MPVAGICYFRTHVDAKNTVVQMTDAQTLENYPKIKGTDVNNQFSDHITRSIVPEGKIVVGSHSVTCFQFNI